MVSADRQQQFHKCVLSTQRYYTELSSAKNVLEVGPGRFINPGLVENFRGPVDIDDAFQPDIVGGVTQLNEDVRFDVAIVSLFWNILISMFNDLRGLAQLKFVDISSVAGN